MDESPWCFESCDALSYVMSVVFGTMLKSGKETLIDYYSFSLMKPEFNQSQIDWEAVGIISAVKKINTSRDLNLK